MRTNKHDLQIMSLFCDLYAKNTEKSCLWRSAFMAGAIKLNYVNESIVPFPLTSFSHWNVGPSNLLTNLYGGFISVRARTTYICLTCNFTSVSLCNLIVSCSDTDTVQCFHLCCFELSCICIIVIYEIHKM
jgi:hypothetical protein